MTIQTPDTRPDPSRHSAPARQVLIVIPTLNEERHIAGVLDGIAAFADRVDALIVVADGGSRDATCRIVRDRAASDLRIRLLDNPGRLQSAAVNLAVEVFGDDYPWILRLDAHSDYPADFGDALLADAAETGADSVVVSMHAEGDAFLQQIIADAQNSRIGNGGSAHRLMGQGAWVEHGHHALMRTQAFRAVGGYDPTFSHNEDAELDRRLVEAGYRIWLTGKTRLTYYPRRAVWPLMRQYFNFGRGRARNLLKHGARPGTRQAAVAALAPAVALVVLSPLHWIFAVPLLIWVAACIAGGAAITVEKRHPAGLLSGFVAGVMHLSWSAGFWRQWLARRSGVQGVSA